MPFKQRAVLLLVLLWACTVEWMLNWRDCHLHIPLKSVSELHWAVILARLWCGTLTASKQRAGCLYARLEKFPTSQAPVFGVTQLGLGSTEWFQWGGVSCSLYQWQITSSSSAVECGTDKDEAVSVQDAAKYRAQNEILVCTGESTALTGDLPASRAPLLF